MSTVSNGPMRRCARLVGTCLLLTLTACASNSPGFYLGRDPVGEEPVAEEWVPIRLTWDEVARHRPPPPPQARPQAGEPGAYRIGVRDALRISVWNHPELADGASGNAAAANLYGSSPSQGGMPANQSAAGSAFAPPPATPGAARIVAEDGSIFFPLVGHVSAAGYTVAEFRERLTTALRRFVRDPQVQVEMAAFRSKRVFVAGAVRTPGVLTVTDIPMRLTDAIAQSGGFAADANQSGVLLNRSGSTQTIDLEGLYYHGDLRANLLLQDGDVVTVRDLSERKVFVLGEFMAPKPVLLRNARVTLAEVIADVGGPNPLTSNTGRLYLIRADEQGRPRIFVLDARSPDALVMADQFAVRPRDIVYVDPTQIARVGRLVNQITPFLNWITTTRALTGN